ncbi:stage II sporulation protein M [Desulfosarcina sp. OttesenSCG-928-G10]|nr:stage II sporulation protein M [Desulfosarcina sp. OttesenSCG-928-G10]
MTHGNFAWNPDAPDNTGGGPGPGPDLGPNLGSDQALVLRSAEFRKGREHAWKSLDEMVGRVEKKGISVLSATEAQALPLLYRAAMSSLSVARNIVLDRNLLLYLENLCLRACMVVYGPRTSVLRSLREFFTADFPRNVRAMRRHLLLAFLTLVIGAVAGFIMVSSDMDYFTILVPESLAGGRGPDSTAEELRNDELFVPWPGFIHTFIVFANSLFRHNTMVGILCFGLGFALGLPTIFLLFYNGLILGAFLSLHAKVGLAVDFIAWLAIHGVTEILAILLCGAAGLVVAGEILFPGPRPRLESLALHGRKAASVAAGAVLLFFIAGFLEGGFRQLINHTPGRYGFALATAAVWLWYFTCVGKKGEKRDTH